MTASSSSEPAGEILTVRFSDALEERYLAYALSTMGRAIPPSLKLIRCVMQQHPFGSRKGISRLSVPARWHQFLVSRSWTNGLSVFCVTTLSVFALYCISNLHLFQDIVYLDADIAADAILAEKA